MPRVRHAKYPTNHLETVHASWPFIAERVSRSMSGCLTHPSQMETSGEGDDDELSDEQDSFRYLQGSFRHLDYSRSWYRDIESPDCRSSSPERWGATNYMLWVLLQALQEDGTALVTEALRRRDALPTDDDSDTLHAISPTELYTPGESRHSP